MCKSFRKKIQSLSKNKQNILATVFILMDFLIIIFMISLWVSLKKVAPEIVREKSEKSIEEQQLEELNALRKDTSPLTEEETKQQLKELEALREKD